MSPIFEEEGKLTTDDLLDLRKRNRCQECGGMLNVFMDSETGKAFLACNDWPRTHHEGIERERSRYEKEGLASLNIKTRREIMEEQHGTGITTALEKARLPMTGALTKPQAMDILKLVYPDVPEPQIIRTAILCRDFGLHPLMKEVYIIGYKNTKTGKIDYSTVLGIAANRKLAADKKGPYSFLDDTPRAASEAEIIKQFGKNSEEEKGNLISFCKVKGQDGNIAVGFGLWPENEEPKAKKGNTKRNMCNIRSERQAIDRLPGPAVPLRGLEVIDVDYTVVPGVGKVSLGTGEITEGEFTEVEEQPEAETPLGDLPRDHWCQEHNCEFTKKTKYGKEYWSHPDSSSPTGWCNEKKKKETASKGGPHVPEPEPEPPALDSTVVPDRVSEPEPAPAMEPEPEPEPATGTLQELQENMALCNWSYGEVGKYCNTDRGWGITSLSDLKPDQLAEVIAHIKSNPK